jgi:hypothetical protein
VGAEAMLRRSRSSFIPRVCRLHVVFALLASVAMLFAPALPASFADGPEPPSEKTLNFEDAVLHMRFPNNWKAKGQGSSFNIAPEDGIVYDTKGRQSVAYGIVLDLFAASDTIGKKLSLDDATGQLIQKLMRGNRNLQVSGPGEHIRVDGRESVSTHLTNDSPAGGKETDWMVTAKQEDALLYFVFVAPDAAFPTYETTFKSILASVRWRH